MEELDVKIEKLREKLNLLVIRHSEEDELYQASLEMDLLINEYIDSHDN